MQVYPERLKQQLQDQLAPVYLVFGDDPFLVAEACDNIRQAAKSQGFDERKRLVQDKDFDWHALVESSQTLSLFSSQQLIELELPELKLGRDGGKALTDFSAQQAPDQILLLFGPQLKKAQKDSKWFKTLTQKGVFVPVYTPSLAQLPNYIRGRAQQLELRLSQDAVQLLASLYEGNLLALQQSLEKLQLLYLNQNNAQSSELNAEQVQTMVEDNSRYDLFALQDAILSQDYAAFVHCMQRLLETGTDIVLIHWLLVRLHQSLKKVRYAQRQNKPVKAAMEAEQIWDKNQTAFLALLSSDSPARNHARIELLERLELAIKRDSGEDPIILALHAGLLFFQQGNRAIALNTYARDEFYSNSPYSHFGWNL